MEQLLDGIEKAKHIFDEFSEAYFKFYLAIILDEKYHKTDEAVEMMLGCIEVFQKYSEAERAIDAYSSLSNFEVHRENLFQAKSYATKAFQLTQKNGLNSKYHFLDLAERHHKLGWVEHHLGNYEIALKEYNIGLSLLISEKINDNAQNERIRKQLIAASYHHLGLSYDRIGDAMNAKDVFLKSVNTLREINFKIDLAKSLYQLAHIHFKQAEYGEGETYLNEATALYFEIGEYAECVRCLDLKGRLYFTFDEKEKAYDIFIECCDMLEKYQTDLKLLEDFYQKIGDINFRKNDLEKASDYYNKAKELSEKNNHFFGTANALSSLAQIEKKKGNNEGYTKILLNAISVLSNSLNKIESEERKAFLIATIGHYQALLNEYQESIFSFSRAKIIYEQKHSVSGIARCMGEIARIYHLQKRENEAFDIMRAVKKIVDGSTDYELIAGSAITLADYQLGLGNYQEAKILCQEAEFLNKKFHFYFTNDIKRLMQRIDTAIEINKPIEISFEGLLEDLFEFIAWFPEAKESIFRMWFYCRQEEIFGNIKALHGVKLMICVGNFNLYLKYAKDFHCYMDSSFQVVDDDFPDTAIDFIPFPNDKIFYPKMAMPTGKYVDGVLSFNMNGALESRYTICGADIMTSKTTGNEGPVVVGWAPGLPSQAYKLIQNSNAKKLIEKKVFFFPHERHKANDKLLSDLHMSKLYHFIPVYTKVLPGSKFVMSLEYFDFKIPISSKSDVVKIAKHLPKFKSTLKKLATATKAKWRDKLDDLKIEIEEINEVGHFSTFINLRIQLLEYQGLLEKEYSAVLIIK